MFSTPPRATPKLAWVEYPSARTRWEQGKPLPPDWSLPAAQNIHWKMSEASGSLLRDESVQDAGQNPLQVHLLLLIQSILGQAPMIGSTISPAARSSASFFIMGRDNMTL